MSSLPARSIEDNGRPEDDYTLPRSLLDKFVGGFKHLWDLRSQGDCHVVVSWPAPQGSQPKPVKKRKRKSGVVEDANRTVKCHSSMLIAGSEYFRKRLQRDGSILANSSGSNNHNQQQLKYVDDQKDGITYLVEQVASSEFDAFNAMVDFFYLARIDPALKVADLLKLLELSDRFAALECREATLYALEKVLVRDMNDGDANIICSFQPTNMAGWKEIEDLANRYLLDTFGKAYQIVEDATLLARWKELTWNAIRLVLTSDELELDSEETVAHLVACWVKVSKEFQDKTSKYYADVVSDIKDNIIHFSLLSSSSFGRFMKENGSWLSLTQQHDIYKMIQAPKDASIVWDTNFPSLWYTARRRALISRELSCSVEVSESEFFDALKAFRGTSTDSKPQEFSGTLVYAKGYMLRAHVNFRPPGFCLHVCIIPLLHFDQIVVLNAAIWQEKHCYITRPNISNDTRKHPWFMLSYLIPSQSLELPRPDLTQKYFRNGKMALTVRIESII